jgi:hypothetical protein
LKRCSWKVEESTLDNVIPYRIDSLAIPTQEEVEAHLLKRKQEELLEKYAVASFQ